MRKPKTTFYGKLCDTGQLTIRAKAGYFTESGFIDPSTIELRVEIWSSVPFGPSQNRAHCMEVFIPAPMSDHKYEDAYKRVLGEYQDYWKEWGATVPPDWKEQLARACGVAMQSFMKSSIMQMAGTLN